MPWSMAVDRELGNMGRQWPVGCRLSRGRDGLHVCSVRGRARDSAGGEVRVQLRRLPRRSAGTTRRGTMAVSPISLVRRADAGDRRPRRMQTVEPWEEQGGTPGRRGGFKSRMPPGAGGLEGGGGTMDEADGCRSPSLSSSVVAHDGLVSRDTEVTGGFLGRDVEVARGSTGASSWSRTQDRTRIQAGRPAPGRGCRGLMRAPAAGSLLRAPSTSGGAKLPQPRGSSCRPGMGSASLVDLGVERAREKVRGRWLSAWNVFLK
jgi:hypothetical protein